MSTTKALVTGAAGFIGSRLTAALLSCGVSVVGLDSFAPYYARELKDANLRTVRDHPALDLHEGDLVDADLKELLDGVDVVFHLAAQPGVRASWDAGFDGCLRTNVLATQRLLEAMAQQAPDARLVYSSSSSVYGDAGGDVLSETAELRPRSPYGVTKLAGEQLCGVYAANWGLRTVALRYFTVYGAHQRPDMALHRLITAALTGRPFPMFGDGTQRRDFTHVTDVVAANMAVLHAEVASGYVCNIAGGTIASLTELIRIVEQVTGADVPIERRAVQPGDVMCTAADTSRARQALDWHPSVTLCEGVAEQVAWQRRQG